MGVVWPFFIHPLTDLNMEEQFLNTKEAAAFLQISVGKIYQLTMKKAIPFYKPGGKLYFKKSELIEYINKNKQA